MMPRKLAEFVATGGGAGYLPVFPGTWGALIVAILAGLVHYVLPRWETAFLWLGLLLTTVTGVYSAGMVARNEGEEDPSKVVIDEFAGQFLTYLWVPVSALSLVLGFFLFRIFDIIKPAPARQAEHLPGGWGIMADDLIAGAYSGLVLWMIHTIA